MDSTSPESVSKIFVKIENAFCPVNYDNNICAIQKDCNGLFKANKSEIKSFFVHMLVLNFKKAKNEILSLIELSNRIYAAWMYASKYKKVEVFPVRDNYIKILESIDELIDGLLLYNTKLNDILPLTKYSFQNIKPKLKQQINSLKVAFYLKDVNQGLISVVQKSLLSVIQSKNLIREELYYINNLLLNLKKNPGFTTETLEGFLFHHGFNSKGFLEYYINKSNLQILEDSSIHKQIENIISLQEQLYCLVPFQKSRLNIKDPSIIDQLLLYYKDIKEALNQRLDIRRSEIQDAKLLEANDKVMFNIPVAQFGFLIKLLMEVNLIPKENVGKTFSFFAKYFKTPSANFISSESLQKKSSTVEFSTARKMKSYLIEMVNWINKNYNTSSYSDR